MFEFGNESYFSGENSRLVSVMHALQFNTSGGFLHFSQFLLVMILQDASLQ